MKHRICIGLQELTQPWSIILDQIGVCYEEVDYSRDLIENYSVIILNKRPDSDSISALHSYLQDGGALIETKGIHPFLNRLLFSRKETTYLVSKSSNPDFRHIFGLDIYDEIEVHDDSDLFGGMIHFQVWKRGIIGFFGADISQLITRSGYRRKRFYSDAGLHPDEIVSKVSKQELIQAFTVLLKQLHFRRSLPFIQKWSSPTIKPVFGFRIDTDYGDQASIKALYRILHKNEIKGTWFLHVKAHEDWLSEFTGMKEQELALHGYEHGVSGSLSKTKQNIRTGLKVLSDHTISPKGFCAPYGIWNKALAYALKEFDFQYSSEFSWLYDGLPLEMIEGLPLQIPIHPICTGSLSRKRYDEASMAAYFAQTLKHKLGRYEPVFFYHHPLQPGLKVWEHIFKKVNEEGLHKMTFNEFAEFWMDRKHQKFEAFVNRGNVYIEAEPSSVKYQVSNSSQGFMLVEGGTKVDLQKNHEFQYSNSYLPDRKTVEWLHKMDFKLIKTSLMDWKNRNRL